MSQALFERAAGGRHHAISAGSEAEPHTRPHPGGGEAKGEVGIDVPAPRPPRITPQLAAQADAVVTMGCGDACPVIEGKQQLRVDWDLPDPKDRPIEEVRAARDDIMRRVQALVERLDDAT